MVWTNAADPSTAWTSVSTPGEQFILAPDGAYDPWYDNAGTELLWYGANGKAVYWNVTPTSWTQV